MYVYMCVWCVYPCTYVYKSDKNSLLTVWKYLEYEAIMALARHLCG